MERDGSEPCDSLKQAVATVAHLYSTIRSETHAIWTPFEYRVSGQSWGLVRGPGAAVSYALLHLQKLPCYPQLNEGSSSLGV